MNTIPDTFGLVGRILDGKYAVQALIAEGGFGLVYRGVHRGLHKPVAIKILKTAACADPTVRGQILEKFSQEARLVAGLEHPAIVRVLDFGASSMPSGESAPWMVLEWLEGVPLESDLQSRRGHGGRSPADALSLLRPVLDALAFAHDAGIAHRDLKPANLMMVRARQGDLTLRVLDFGIAKVMAADEPEGASGQTATQSRLQAFTLLYAAPEQVSGTRTGPWTDVHALGLILTELLTDASAYPDQELTESYAAVLSPVRPTPARHGLDVGPWEAVLARAVAFRPVDRYQTAGELLRALEAVVPAAATLVDPPEAVTTPRQRPPVAAVTTLRPAEVRSQPIPITRPRRGRLLGAACVALALLIAGGVSLRARVPRADTPHHALPLATPVFVSSNDPPVATIAAVLPRAEGDAGIALPQTPVPSIPRQGVLPRRVARPSPAPTRTPPRPPVPAPGYIPAE